MQDNALENAFVTVLDAVAGLESVNCYSSHYAGARTTPSITVESKSQSLDGSVAVFRAELEFVVESDANDTLAATHAGYIEAIRAVLANTREMVAGAEQRVITWVLKARSECARFNTHEMIVAWNDPDFAAKQPEHPFGYIKAAFKNYSRALEFVEGQIPLALLRKGRRMALIPMDASVERRDELIKALES